jgi:hypothetical protein
MVSPCNDGLLSKIPVRWGIACKGEGGFIFLTHLGLFPWSDTKFHHDTFKLVAKLFPLVSHGDTGRGQVMDIIHWVVCVDEKRTLVEQGCGVAAQAGDSSIGQGGIHFII